MKLKNYLKVHLEKICEVRSFAPEIFIKKEVRDCNQYCKTHTLNRVSIISIR
jgi:hypothetical protein